MYEYIDERKEEEEEWYFLLRYLIRLTCIFCTLTNDLHTPTDKIDEYFIHVMK